METVEERALDDLIQKLNEAIQKLTDIVNSSIESAVGKLNEIKDTIIANANEVISKAGSTINVLINNVKAEVDKIKEEAENLGDDVKECIDENMAELEQLPQQIMDKLYQCVNDQLTEANSITDEAKGTILKVRDELARLPEKVRECNSSFTCILKLSAQVAKDMSSIPLEIASTVSKATQFIATVKVDMEACGVKKVIEASQEAGEIGEKVIKCVGDKPSTF